MLKVGIHTLLKVDSFIKSGIHQFFVHASGHKCTQFREMSTHFVHASGLKVHQTLGTHNPLFNGSSCQIMSDSYAKCSHLLSMFVHASGHI